MSRRSSCGISSKVSTAIIPHCQKCKNGSIGSPFKIRRPRARCCFNGAKTSGSQVTRTLTRRTDRNAQHDKMGVYHGGSFVSWRSTMRLPPVSGLTTCSVHHEPLASSHEFNIFLFYNYISYHSHISSILYLLLSLSMSSNLFLALFISEKVLLTPRGSLPHARHEGGRSLHDQLFCLGLRCVQKMPKRKRQHPAISSRPSRTMLDK